MSWVWILIIAIVAIALVYLGLSRYFWWWPFRKPNDSTSPNYVPAGTPISIGGVTYTAAVRAGEGRG